MKELNEKSGWEEVWTAHAFKDIIWKQSGHYYKYKDDMFLFTLPNGDNYGLKPMNCPGHIAIFQRSVYSYRDMPVKYSEAGTVYRYEKSGEMGGLTRPRGFTIDDGHGFVREDQIFDETISLLKIIPSIFKTILGTEEITYDLSVMDKQHPENYLMSYECSSCGEKFMLRAASQEYKCPACGSENLNSDFSMWDNATENLRRALEELKLKYTEYPGEAVREGKKEHIILILIIMSRLFPYNVFESMCGPYLFPPAFFIQFFHIIYQFIPDYCTVRGVKRHTRCTFIIKCK